MSKVNELLGMDVFVVKDIDNSLSQKLYKVNNLQREYFIVGEKGNFIRRTEKQKVLYKLQNGEGIVYQGCIFFLKEKIYTSYFKNFMSKYNKVYHKIKKEDEYVNHLKNICGRPIVKAILIMYRNETLTKEKCLEKLKNYFNDVNYVRNLLEDDKRLNKILAS